MRSKSASLGIVWKLIGEIIISVLGVIVPRYIILAFGSDVNGLTATITQIIGVICLLQAGASTTAIYSLYKPIENNDIKKVNQIMNDIIGFYNRIGCIFIVIIFVGSIIISQFINSSIKPLFIFVAFILLGVKYTLDIFISIKYEILFLAFQNQYFVSIGFLLEYTIYYLLIFVVAILRIEFLFMYCGMFTGTLVKILFYRYMYKKKFSHILVKKQKTINQLIISGRKYALANEVSHSITTASVTILISFQHGLTIASIFAVYNMVNRLLLLIGNTIYSSIGPSFGSLIAEGNKEKINKVFNMFQFAFYFINTVLYMCGMYLIVPFIKIYTKGFELNYVNNILAVSLMIYGIVSILRVPYNILVSSYGLFRQTYLQPVLSALISLIFSVILGRYNWMFIILGPLLFYLINFIYQHYILKKLIDGINFNLAINNFLLVMIGFSLSIVANIFFSPNPRNFFSWFMVAMITFIISTFISLTIGFFINRQYLIETYNYLKNFVRSIYKKTGEEPL